MNNMPEKSIHPPLPLQYCGKCGLILRQIPFDRYFSIKTGQPENCWLWICKNKKWWNGHTKFRSDYNGNTYDFEL